MATITGTGGANDVIDVTNNVGTLNGAPQGSPITDIDVDASTSNVTITNSTVSGRFFHDNGFMNATIDGSTIGTFDLSNANSNISLTNTNLTNGGTWGAGDRTVDWQGGFLGGNITSGAGNDNVSIQDVVIADSVTIQGANGDDVWTFNSVDIGNNFSFDSGASNTVVNIINDTNFGTGASFSTGNGSFDQLNLPAGTVVNISGQPGPYTVGTDTFPSGINFSGSFTLPNGSSATFSGYDSFNSTGAPVCFVAGTGILTPTGYVAVDALAVGDMVITADQGPMPIRWIGKRTMGLAGLTAKHKPIEIKANSIALGLPARDIAVSPQHCVLFDGLEIERLFGTERVLARARGLVKLPGVRTKKGLSHVDYYSVMLDSHQAIKAEGLWTESFYPGPNAWRMLTPQQRGELQALFPKLGHKHVQAAYGPPLCRTLCQAQTKRLVRKRMQASRDLTSILKVLGMRPNTRAGLRVPS